MKLRTSTRALLALTLILTVSLVTGDALAQARRGGGNQTARAQTWQRPPVELSATYGHMWGGNLQFPAGRIRTSTGNTLGIALDIPLHPHATLELAYTRQDGGLDWDPNGGSKEHLTDMSVNFWQLGVIRSIPAGAVEPFFLVAIGATYISPEEATFVVDDETYNTQSTTKLSFAFGVGGKAYLGKAKRFGLRASFKVYPTLYNTGAGIYFGTGGLGAGISGNAIWQWEVAGGITVKLGK